MQKILLDQKYDQRDLSVDDRKKHQDRFFELIHEELARHGISRDHYTLGLPDAGNDGRVCLHEENGLWVYYVAERGTRFRAAFFQSLSDAANYLIWAMLCDPNAGNTDIARVPRILKS